MRLKNYKPLCHLEGTKLQLKSQPGEGEINFRFWHGDCIKIFTDLDILNFRREITIFVPIF